MDIMIKRAHKSGLRAKPMAKLNKTPLAGIGVDAEIGERVRGLRKARGWTQGELAAKVGITGVYISDLERGARRWQSTRLAEVAHALDVSPALLQDPSIPLEYLEKVALILEKLGKLSEDKLETIEQVVDGFLPS